MKLIALPESGFGLYEMPDGSYSIFHMESGEAEDFPTRSLAMASYLDWTARPFTAPFDATWKNDHSGLLS